MKTLIIYDSIGYVLNTQKENYRLPSGIPFLEVEIPSGKQIKYVEGIGVDVTVTPHQVILEDIPPSEIETMKTELQSTKAALLELAEAMFGGM